MATQVDFFSDLIPHQWLPDETLFSLCSRHHRLAGNRLASETCKALFGHPIQGSAHDLPSRVAHLSMRFGKVLGTTDEIILQRTLLPYYLPFRSATFSAVAMQAMGGPGIRSLKYQLGLLTSRFRANHPLKACPYCMELDSSQWQIAYWHRVHQLPGVWVCPLHGIPLLRSTMKATGVGRFHWHLPSLQNLEPEEPTVEAMPILVQLGRCASGLLDLPPCTHLDPLSVAKVYRSSLHERGLLKGRGAGRLASRAIGPEYSEYLRPLREISEMAALPASAEEAARAVARLSNPLRTSTHPIRHLAMIGWLFGGLPEFMARYELVRHVPAACTSSKPEPIQNKRNESNEKRKAFLISLIRQDGLSASAAARHVAVDTTTAMVWAAGAGIATRKRPSKIHPKIRDDMLRALRRGVDKTEVAKLGNVTIESVTRLLGTEVGLREAWTVAKFLNAQSKARERWLSVTGSNPISGIKAVRLIEPAAFAWLYRNDREWLDSQCAKLPRHAHTHGGNVNWDKRDADLSHLIRGACLQIAKLHPGTRIKLWQIYQRLPALKAKLAHLDRLPLTCTAISAAIAASTRESPI
jgi:transposase